MLMKINMRIREMEMEGGDDEGNEVFLEDEGNVVILWIKGSGDEGKWWGREMVMKGNEYEGKWWFWEIIIEK